MTKKRIQTLFSFASLRSYKSTVKQPITIVDGKYISPEDMIAMNKGLVETFKALYEKKGGGKGI